MLGPEVRDWADQRSQDLLFTILFSLGRSRGELDNKVVLKGILNKIAHYAKGTLENTHSASEVRVRLLTLDSPPECLGMRAFGKTSNTWALRSANCGKSGYSGPMLIQLRFVTENGLRRASKGGRNVWQNRCVTARMIRSTWIGHKP
ncbi:hypothetical protein PILCRDRAFT_815706 [Piloderma croceum F 1598]|uniref:Uncharacterized protein n=1 Tax=Piloderma croceum (strain F 1598) TaxID=765440 RepID=A0A0C3BLA8_PILCF|nr:hypothetical protein PILCRDRAFT_815706 [Piloderma croceum F 1598]